MATDWSILPFTGHLNRRIDLQTGYAGISIQCFPTVDAFREKYRGPGGRILLRLLSKICGSECCHMMGKGVSPFSELDFVFVCHKLPLKMKLFAKPALLNEQSIALPGM